MLILGGDYHPDFQQIVFVDTETGELEERRLTHGEKAEQFIKNSSSETKAFEDRNPTQHERNDSF